MTGACCAVARSVFDELGGFDERFQLTGSDVALGLDAVLEGLRNVCSPHAAVRHLESATRGTTVPTADFFASYWRYNTWLFGGDPYWNPNLSLRSGAARAARPRASRRPRSGWAASSGGSSPRFRQRSDAAESRLLAAMCRVRDADERAIGADARASNAERVPGADRQLVHPRHRQPVLRRHQHRAADRRPSSPASTACENRFVVWGSPPDHFVRSALAAAFPPLADCEIVFYDETTGPRARARRPTPASRPSG